MKLLLSPYFYVGLLIYLIIKISRVLTPGVMPSWINNYLSDLLCIPLTLMIILAFIRILKRKDVMLPVSAIVLVTVYFALYFEYYLPDTSTKFVGDFVDVLMYIAGAVLFYMLQRRITIQDKLPLSN